MAVADFDGDGRDDLRRIKTFSHAPETGRLNGGTGLLLLGDGKGGFRSLMERESGIFFKETQGLARSRLER